MRVVSHSCYHAKVDLKVTVGSVNHTGVSVIDYIIHIWDVDEGEK